MDESRIGLIGASSLVGAGILSRIPSGRPVVAFSRNGHLRNTDTVSWRRLNEPASSAYLGQDEIPYWISVAPIWVLPQHFGLFEQTKARRIVVLSSTSVVVKGSSRDPWDQAASRRLAEGEDRLRAWADARGIQWVVLRPTLIYGYGRDKNVSEIARLVRRFHIFPLVGAGDGARQPVHAEDVAQACLAALESPSAANRSYDLTGAESLAYRDMVSRIFVALGRTPRFVRIPRDVFRIVLPLLRTFSRYRHWSLAMVERMNSDLVFDYSDAARDLGYAPRPFHLTKDDLPAP